MGEHINNGMTSIYNDRTLQSNSSCSQHSLCSPCGEMFFEYFSFPTTPAGKSRHFD